MTSLLIRSRIYVRRVQGSDNHSSKSPLPTLHGERGWKHSLELKFFGHLHKSWLKT